MTRIAIDAMGGDHAPHEIVKGALWAADEYNVAIELVGKEDEIKKVIVKSNVTVSGLVISILPREESELMLINLISRLLLLPKL